MSASKVLGFVARELKGQIMTISSLAAFVAAEKAADKLGMNETSRQAAQLAVLLPSVPRERICSEFDSQTADIFEALRPRGYFLGIANVAMTVYRNSENDKVRRDAAIAVVAAEVAAGSPEDGKNMAKSLEAMANQEADSKRSKFIKDLIEQLPEPISVDSRGKSRGQSTVISISMDICGSTEAKETMRECAGGNQEQLSKWYENFHHQFLSLEWEFYLHLFRNGSRGLDWDWKRAFFVKGIGDEIWLLYDVSDVDQRKLRSLATRLFHAALDVATEPLIRWSPTSDDLSQQLYESRNLPLKFYMDILDDAYEVNEQRCKFVTKRLEDFLDLKENLYNRELIELGNRLHASSSLMGDGRRLTQTIRTDYIGWEVDRYFRATNFALPLVVTVGQNLFERVFYNLKKSGKCLISTKLQKAMIECQNYQGGPTRPYDKFRYVKEDIAPRNLKGVGKGYTVYRVLRKEDLSRLYDTCADKAIMKETFKVFTRKMVQTEL